ncbi:family 78 glycoside hydrolase catalytic domain [Pedobacter heparinus]|uniref:alpha-L-rhamnosidase n=1 Tax=Pedobacter heparinus (strain ATCC 13125 / DSM 2366 / CIP 104194 / JCM 7457 / NBRC 12017 / NCIMB 9290 / NRRL B-14731 / HIM 762-3) TaxID=485917 RepID=C6Y133_PEDHD|nr:family 78 glycoside hydrolase catalytic domain [Pedobacter heparinus]ACU04960.1 alpha-L-rhamnosidase [Pedobacter heparinus DSM 2366]
MSKLIYFLGLFFFTIPVFSQQLKVNELRCTYKNNPQGVESPAPALSWKLFSAQRNVLQSAYHIIVADDALTLAKGIGNVWDSKKVASARSLLVNYNGKPLISGKTYYWKVKVWDNNGLASAWSDTATWQMGLLTVSDWKNAKWIGYEKMPDSLVTILPLDTKKDKPEGNNIQPLLRKEFRVNKAVKKATMFISGLGHFELQLNGRKVGDHFLDPGWTKYDKEALYIPFDITAQLKDGNNALGVMLGNGFYYIPPIKARYKKLRASFGYPKMICRLLIEYKDGSVANIISDESWKTAASAITFSSIYGGEDYDANLEQKGWDIPGFDDKHWKSAVSVGGPALTSQKAEPLKVFDQFTAKTIKPLGNGDWVYDLGQNASAIIELTVKGKKGDTVKIIPAELLKADGTANQRATGSPTYFQYILKGDGAETWRPRFMYTGFRYLQVIGGIPEGQSNTTGKPSLITLKSLHVRNAAATAGSFESSSELFNKTDDLVNWAIKSNMVSVFTDCPHREKLGWLEELHLMGSSVRYNYDAAALFKKALQDMRNSQTADGLVPEISPEYVKFDYGNGMFRDSPEWGSSSILVPWYLYEWYGETQALAENYDMMQRYVAYLGTKAKNNILSQGLGDWFDLGPERPGVSQLTPMGVTGTAIYYYDLNVMEKIALLLGKNADAGKYAALAMEVKKSFNDTFFNTETKQYATGSQTANAMAVYMNLVAPEYKDAVVANLVKDIRDRNNGLTAGDIGYRYVLRVLEAEGRSDVIYDMNSRTDVPGYGYQLAQGATALTESWAALPTVSNNHFMLGHIMEWFYSGIGGIRQEKGAVAFNHIRIYPEPVGDLRYAKSSYQSPYGEIASNWRKTADAFELDVIVPANTKATVYLPATATQQVSESGQKIRPAGFEKGRAVVQVGSGNYKFKVQ